MKVDPKAQLLIETYELSGYQLDESAKSEGRVVLKGVFAKADVPTKNKRIYGRSSWVENIARMKPDMKRKAVKGEVDHPADGKTRLSRVSHFLTDLELESDGTIVGTMELLPDKPGSPASQLHSIIQAGGVIGVSSRGFGLTETDKHGNTVIKEGTFRLDTFDAVEDPAVKSAYPTVYYEDVCRSCGLEEEELQAKLEEATKMVAQLTERVSGSDIEPIVRQRLAAQLSDAFNRKRAELEESIRSDLLTDPKTGLARKIIEQIAMLVAPFGSVHVGESEDLKVELADLRAKLSEATNMVHGLTMRLRLEEALRGEQSTELFEQLIGDVGQYDLDSLNARIVAIRRELEKSGLRKPVVEAQEYEEAASKASDMIEALRGELEEQRELLQESIRANRELAAERDGALEEASKPGERESELRTENERLRAEGVRLKKELKGVTELAERSEFEVSVERLIAHRADREAIRETVLKCGDIQEAKNMLRRMSDSGGATRSVREQVLNRVSRGREVFDDSALGSENVGSGVVSVGPAPNSPSGSSALAEELLEVGILVETARGTNGGG